MRAAPTPAQPDEGAADVGSSAGSSPHTAAARGNADVHSLEAAPQQLHVPEFQEANVR